MSTPRRWWNLSGPGRGVAIVIVILAVSVNLIPHRRYQDGETATTPYGFPMVGVELQEEERAPQGSVVFERYVWLVFNPFQLVVNVVAAIAAAFVLGLVVGGLSRKPDSERPSL